MDRGSPAGAGDPPEWMTRQERGSLATIRLTVGAALALGRPVMRMFLPAICVYFLVFSGASREASRSYLERALGRRARWTDIFRHYLTFATCVLDRIYFLKDRTDQYDFHIEGEEIVTDILARGQGCILVGAHMGSFEALRTVGRRQPALRVNMVMYEENARKVNSVLNAINPELAKDIISLGSPNSFLEIQSCLNEGHFVGILADRSLSGERQITRSFLGDPAHFSINPFRMVAVLRRPIIFMIALYRGGGRYDIHFERLVGPEEIPTRVDNGEVEAIATRYIEKLERYCRLAPYNWFNFFNIWR